MYGILVDVTACTGCERCVAACVKENGLEVSMADADRSIVRDGLSAHRWSTVVKVGEGRFARKSCMHCLDPSCVSACLVGAITKSPEGPVVYDPRKCIGCRYCMLACPFQIPRYEWDKTVPFMRKCDMCASRLEKDERPACVEACPQHALDFGNREDLLSRAEKRIASNPGRYIPRVWGKGEFGGTGVLYVSDVDLKPLGWPEHHTVPIPSLTEPLIHMTPFVGVGVATCMLAVNWVIKRRMLLSQGTREEGKDAVLQSRERDS
jgi:formate dehydrogenase iron-sulfur subunit